MELALAAMGFQLFLRKPFDIFRRGLLPVTPRSISLGGHDLRSLTLVQGHCKKSGNQSCVSFGEECILLKLWGVGQSHS